MKVIKLSWSYTSIAIDAVRALFSILIATTSTLIITKKARPRKHYEIILMGYQTATTEGYQRNDEVVDQEHYQIKIRTVRRVNIYA